jgi:type IV pilus assembly protein PilM
MFAPERIIGLDIGASTLKVGEFTASKMAGLHLNKFTFASLGGEPESEENRKQTIVATLRNALQEAGIKSKRVVFSVSGQSVFTRFVKLPPVEEAKIAQIIFYEAQQNVPFPIDEVVWDYQLIGDNIKEQQDVVLLAIKSNIIEDLNEGVESAGLTTAMVDVAPMAVYNAVRYNYGDPEQCIVLLDIGARTTNLLFIEKQKIFSRSIPIAGNAITQSIAAEFGVPFGDAEKMKRELGMVALGGAYEDPEDETQARLSKIIRNVMTRLHAEVARSINFYRTQQGGTMPTKLLLAGGSSIMPYTDRFFQEKIRVDTEYFNPFRNVEIDPGISREQLSECAHFFGEVVGLGLRKVAACPIEVNLLPNSLKSRQANAQKLPYFVAAAAASLFVPLCLWGFTANSTGGKEGQIDDLKRQIKQLEETKEMVKAENARYTEVEGRINQLEGVLYPRFMWLELLEALNKNVADYAADIVILNIEPITVPTPATAPVPPTAEGKRPPAGAPSVTTSSVVAIKITGTIRMDREPYKPTEVQNLYGAWFESLKTIDLIQSTGIQETDTINVHPMQKKKDFTVQLPLKAPIPL